MKKRITCLALCILLLLGVASYNGTRAWFATGTTKHQYLTSGKINYLLSGNLISVNEEVVLPGTELIENDLTIENFSNIRTQLRISIRYDYYDSNGILHSDIMYDSNNSSSVLEVTMDEIWIKGNSDDYYYYNGESGVLNARSSSNDENVLSLISSLKYKGASTKIQNSGKTVSVTILIEGKQADYVTWQQLGELSI